MLLWLMILCPSSASPTEVEVHEIMSHKSMQRGSEDDGPFAWATASPAS